MKDENSQAELILFPPKKDIWEMEVGGTYGFNCEGKHWTITRNE